MFKKRILPILLALCLTIAMLPTMGFAATKSSTNSTNYNATVISTVDSDSNTLTVEAYLTNDEYEVYVPQNGDIIFVLDQSKWMDTYTDRVGEEFEQRALVLEALDSLIYGISDFADDNEEHHVAIVGYGSIEDGTVTTGYYTTSGFQPLDSWADVADTNSMPQLDEALSNSLSYDEAFMSLEDAKSVVENDIIAWDVEASRLDAGLVIADKLAELVREQDSDSDDESDLVVCVFASTLPNAQLISQDDSFHLGITDLCDEMKNDKDAKIYILANFNFASYEIDEDDSDAEKESIWLDFYMTCYDAAGDNSVASGAYGDKSAYFKMISQYSDIESDLEDLMFEIQNTIVGNKTIEYTVSSDEFAAFKSGLAHADNAFVVADYYTFAGYNDDDEPTFVFSSTETSALASSLDKKGNLSFTTRMTLLPAPGYTGVYGTKVVLTISDAVQVTYAWADGNVPTDAKLPETAYIMSGTTYTANALTTKESYKFNGWYTDKEATTKYTASALTEDITLYGKWSVVYDSSDSDGGDSTTDNNTSNNTTNSTTSSSNTVMSPFYTGVADLLNVSDHDLFLRGYTDGSFAPDNNMTRAEVAQMFYRLLLSRDVEITASFNDVQDNQWYATAVNTLASLDILRGYEDGSFMPNESITRAEFTAIAMRFGKLDNSGQNKFSDVSADAWYYDYIVGSIKYGWITGYEGGVFMPESKITRAEVATVTNRMLGRYDDKSFIDNNHESLVKFGDLNNTHWAYYTIMEATNPHNYVILNGTHSWTSLNTFDINID
jgi:uncharacterized repeat protein (TIGR02543 family)